MAFLCGIISVSYTHLDVYKRQFLFCTNSVGSAGNTKCGGHAAVYGPMGECLVLGGEGEQILMADMDIGAVDGVRRCV